MPVLAALLASLLDVLAIVINLFLWVLIISAILSWLVAFEVVNPHNRLIQVVGSFCYRVTEPFLKPIRRFLPPLGGIDLSPLVLILLIMFLESFLHRLLVFGA